MLLFCVISSTVIFRLYSIYNEIQFIDNCTLISYFQTPSILDNGMATVSNTEKTLAVTDVVRIVSYGLC